MSEIQYQNRVLLRKMLSIDLKAQQKKDAHQVTKEDPNPSALNQYNSLNRQTRIRELARIVDDNKQMLGRLQTTKSNYNGAKWEHNF